MPGIEDLHFVTTHPVRMSMRRWPEIEALRRSFHGNILEASGRSQEEIAFFLGKTTSAVWDNLNESGLRGRFSKHRVVGAYNRYDELQGYVYGVNNASSQHSGAAAVAEQLAKLHVPLPKFRDARYLKLHEMVGPDEPTIAAMTGLLIDEFSLKQPVSDFPYTEETDLRARLQEWGIVPPEGEKPETVDPFGPEAEPTEQIRCVAEHAGVVLDRIVEMYPNAMRHARVFQSYDTASMTVPYISSAF